MGRGITLVLLAAICWGTSGTASTYAPESAGSLSIGSIRIIIGALGLLVVALIEGRGRARPSWPWALVLIGSVGGQLAFFTAIDRAGAGDSRAFPSEFHPAGVTWCGVPGERYAKLNSDLNSFRALWRSAKQQSRKDRR
jgi:hypothetical protein